jgi:hypothetical protein
MPVQACFSYEDNPFLSDDTDANRLEIVFAISARWMLRSEQLFRGYSSPVIPFPGIPAGATALVEVLSLMQDDRCDKEPLEVAGELMAEIGSYSTDSDTEDDLTYRAYMSLRYSGFSAKIIADKVAGAAEGGYGDTVTPKALVQQFGTIPPMEPLQRVAATPMRVGQSTPKAASTPFLSHQVSAESLQGRVVKGSTMAQLQETDGAAWSGIKVLRADRLVGVVLGVAVKSDAESKVWFSVAYSNAPNDAQVVSANKEVFKCHIAYEAEASKADLGSSPGDALTLALRATPAVNDYSGDHRSKFMLSSEQVAKVAASLGTPIPGAAPLVPASYSGAQIDHIVANQLSIPVNSRQAAAQVHTFNWLDSVSPHARTKIQVRSRIHFMTEDLLPQRH